MRSLIRIALILTIVGSGLTRAPVARATQPPTIDAEQSVEMDFPRSVTFRLSATAPSSVTRAELRFSVSGKDYSNSAVTEVDSTRSVEIEHEVDTQLDYIEPGVDVSYHWMLEDDDGPVAQTEERTFTWIDGSLEWHRHESADVFLYSYGGDDAFDDYTLQIAQESADRFKIAYDIAEIEPMRIWVYASTADFARSLRQNSETWIGGYSLPEAGVIALPIEPGDDFSVRRTISHEVSHHVLYQATQNPFSYPPTWLDEGLAVAGQLAGNSSDPEIVLGALAEGTLPTLRTLSSSFPTDPAAANRSYATSHMAVRYIIETWGDDAITSLIQQFRLGTTADSALIAVLGVDMDELDSQFRTWLSEQD